MGGPHLDHVVDGINALDDDPIGRIGEALGQPFKTLSGFLGGSEPDVLRIDRPLLFLGGSESHAGVVRVWVCSWIWAHGYKLRSSSIR